MHSLLIISFHQEGRNLALADYEHKVSPFDLAQLDATEDGGIDKIRELQAFATRKPTEGPKNLIIIKEAQHLSLEAQNALLKTLEEPPLYTQIILTVSTAEALLPTVVSRCERLYQNLAPAQAQDSPDWTALKTVLKSSDAQIINHLEKLDLGDWVKLWHRLFQAKVNQEETLEELTLSQVKRYLAKLATLHQWSQENSNPKLIHLVAALNTPKIKS